MPSLVKQLRNLASNRQRPIESFGTRARQTTDYDYPIISNFHYVNVGERVNQIRWKLTEFTDEYITGLNVTKIIDLITQVSPDASHVLKVNRRFINSGYRLDTEMANPADVEYIENYFSYLNDIGKPVSGLTDQMADSSTIAGAIFSEQVFDDDGVTPIDTVVIDPYRAAFQLDNEGPRGQRYKLGQRRVNGFFDSFENDFLIKYVATNPVIGKPWGMPPLGSAIQPIVFQLGFFHDIRQVIKAQSYLFKHVKINVEEVFNMTGQDEDTIKEQVKAEYTDATNRVAALKNNEIFGSGDHVNIELVSGTTRQSLGGLDAIIRTLERRMNLGLNSFPVIMGQNESLAESSADTQFLIHSILILATQKAIENIWNSHIAHILRAAGRRSTITLTLERVNAAERLREAGIATDQEAALTAASNRITLDIERGYTTLEDGIMEYNSIKEGMKR